MSRVAVLGDERSELALDAAEGLRHPATYPFNLSENPKEGWTTLQSNYQVSTDFEWGPYEVINGSEVREQSQYPKLHLLPTGDVLAANRMGRVQKPQNLRAIAPKPGSFRSDKQRLIEGVADVRAT